MGFASERRRQLTDCSIVPGSKKRPLFRSSRPSSPPKSTIRKKPALCRRLLNLLASLFCVLFPRGRLALLQRLTDDSGSQNLQPPHTSITAQMMVLHEFGPELRQAPIRTASCHSPPTTKGRSSPGGGGAWILPPFSSFLLLCCFLFFYFFCRRPFCPKEG